MQRHIKIPVMKRYMRVWGSGVSGLRFRGSGLRFRGLGVQGLERILGHDMLTGIKQDRF